MEENDSGETEAALRPVVRLAQKRQIAIGLLHHAGKTGVEYRGSTAIGAAVQLGFTLSRHEDDPQKRTRRRLTCWKCRPALEPDDRWLTIDATDGRITISEAAVFSAQRAKRDSKAEQLTSALDRPRTWSEWAQAAGLDKSNGTARRARDELEASGLVTTDEHGRYVPTDQ